MNDQSGLPTTIEKLVVFFDICSSTKVLEDLHRSDNAGKWRELLVEQKNFLRKKRRRHGFEMYKFLGDGWVLLFPVDVDGGVLMTVMKELSDHYHARFRKFIKPLLSVSIPNEGLTFGIDRGILLPMIMSGRREYAGRALNVAARLQGAIAQGGETHPADKILISNSAYAGISAKVRAIHRVDSVKRELKNISEETNYLCKRVWLNARPMSKSTNHAQQGTLAGSRP